LRSAPSSDRDGAALLSDRRQNDRILHARWPCCGNASIRSWPGTKTPTTLTVCVTIPCCRSSPIKSSVPRWARSPRSAARKGGLLLRIEINRSGRLRVQRPRIIGPRNSPPSPILEIKISNGVYERDSLHRGFQFGEWLLKPGDGSNYSVREFGPGAAPHGAIGFPLSSRGASGFQE